MSGTRFEWDVAKSQSNLRKHGVSFENASLVFRDPLHISVLDRIENGEQRWQTYGQVWNVTILVVAHTIVDSDEDGQPVEIIRIISARRADRKERQRYEHENNQI
ncbi:BrnT family toxin [Phyllobacterium myrsinacearum]|uniref:BrnT family toxin n=1 Tax=Phyllobacterium myrsinacearum TaxID=28101 RepID=UPI0015FB6A07|nr:BrnT family toxin [Phyllobacterium myrsinacearum]